MPSNEVVRALAAAAAATGEFVNNLILFTQTDHMRKSWSKRPNAQRNMINDIASIIKSFFSVYSSNAHRFE